MIIDKLVEEDRKVLIKELRWLDRYCFKRSQKDNRELFKEFLKKFENFVRNPRIYLYCSDS